MTKNLLNRLFIYLVFFSLLGSIGNAQPINTNGGFEESTLGTKTASDIAGWIIYLSGTAAADFEIVEDEVWEGSKALWITLSSIGTNPWDAQIVNEPFNVEPNTKYKYSLWVKADIEGTIVDFTVGDPSYKEWGRAHQVPVGTSWQEVTFEFTTSADAVTGRAPIHLGEPANGGLLPVGYYIDNLQITNLTTGVEEKNQILTNYKLSQNYPNPFNPVTNIEFSLPVTDRVTLSLLNVFGEVVKVIANGNFSAGNHKVKLDGSDLATGVYFYRLEAGNFVDVKKLLLMK
jgi:hypothetical protein